MRQLGQHGNVLERPPLHWPVVVPDTDTDLAQSRVGDRRGGESILDGTVRFAASYGQYLPRWRRSLDEQSLRGRGARPEVFLVRNRSSDPAAKEGSGVEIAAQLAKSFGIGRVTAWREVARGAMGAVWRLETSAGAFAAKNLFWDQGDAASIQREVSFRAACAEAGVPSPSPLVAVDGQYVVQVGDERWRLYEWADGEVPHWRDPEAAGWLAEQMGVIHALDWPGGVAEVVPWYHRVDVDWPLLFDAAETARVEWAAALNKLQPRLDELTDLVNAAPIGDQVWCHRDLRNANVLRSADRNYLVDWDNVGTLAPWRELGALLMHHLDHPGNLRRIVNAYRAAGGPAVLDGPVGFATGVAISLNFLHGQASAALDVELAEEHRAFAARQVVDLLSSFPTLDLLEQAAEVIRST